MERFSDGRFEVACPSCKRGHETSGELSARPRSRLERAALSNSQLFLTTIVTAGLLSVGCSNSDGLVPVDGVVLLDGKPIPKAAVMFHHPAGQTAYAVTGNDGSFQLTTRNPGDGVKPGECKITVSLSIQRGGVQPNTAGLEDYSKPITPATVNHIIPPSFNDPRTSPLTLTVAKPIHGLTLNLQSGLPAQ